MTVARTERERALLEAYKTRKVVGGVCAIRNETTGRTLVYPAADPKGQHNRFRFSVSTNTCVHAALAADWRSLGPEAFSFRVLEELERGPEQTEAAFRADLETLAEIWREKLAGSGTPLY